MQGLEAGSDFAYKRKARQREDTSYQDQQSGQAALMRMLSGGGGQSPMGPQMQPGQPSQPMQLPGAQPTALQNAVYGQESGYGANPQTSPKGAVGGMQIMPGTFQQFARPGENINDPSANKAVGNRSLETYTQKFGDPARALVAYFSGPGNVAPPGSPTPWKEDKSDGRVRVSQYVQQTLGRMGGGGQQPQGGMPQQGGAPQQGGDWRSFAQRIIQTNPDLT
ncbi:MAG: lytic transglycosylase domain-containing protein, partial [Phycisphaerales bacterium]